MKLNDFEYDSEADFTIKIAHFLFNFNFTSTMLCHKPLELSFMIIQKCIKIITYHMLSQNERERRNVIYWSKSPSSGIGQQTTTNRKTKLKYQNKRTNIFLKNISVSWIIELFKPVDDLQYYYYFVVFLEPSKCICIMWNLLITITTISIQTKGNANFLGILMVLTVRAIKLLFYYFSDYFNCDNSIYSEGLTVNQLNI